MVEPPSHAPPGATLPDAAYGAALAGLPWMGPRRLLALARRWDPAATWARIGTGTAHDDPAVHESAGTIAATLVAAWQRAAAATDVAHLWSAHEDAGIAIRLLGTEAYPEALADDPEPALCLFVQGDLDRALRLPRVAIVGSRRCTHYGREVARQLGFDLAGTGVSVVSGLALGIDGASHQGALAAHGEGGAPPIGVVAGGLDAIYPRRHAALWRAVAESGALVAEAPLGTRPEAWRFPARNRIIAALAQVVVVVEAHVHSGSTHTVEEANTRSRTVMAVPGPVRSPASAGTNLLIRDGVAVCTGAADVLDQLGLSHSVSGRSPRPPRPRPDAHARRVLDAVGWQPASLEQIALRLDRGLGEVALLVEALARDGWLGRHGGWWERIP